MEGGIRLRLYIERNPQVFVRLNHTRRVNLDTSAGTVEYALGPRKGTVQVYFDGDTNPDEIVVSSNFAYGLGIRDFAESMDVQIFDNRLNFGTMLGILCTPRWNEKTHSLRSTKQLPILQKLMDIAERENVLCFAFDIRDIEWQHQRVKGYRYRAGRFTSDIFPLPNVIYDQVISRKQERNLKNVKLHQRLLGLYGNRLFNPGFLDKWEVYEWLQEDVQTAAFIPKTVRYASVHEAARFLNQHAVTYCKPVHGSLGLGIFKVEQLPDGGFSYLIRRRQGTPIQGKANSAEEALSKLRKRLNSKPYLLQQGIALIRVDGRPFDIRIVMQRDGHGEWKRTKMFARLAERGQITSNISTGGEAVPLPTVIEQLFPTETQRRRIIQAVRRVSRNVPGVIEAQSHKQFGELGIDVGVDNQGGAWIIEVNSKPWKTTATEKGRTDLVDLAFERPIHYAKFMVSQPQ